MPEPYHPHLTASWPEWLHHSKTPGTPSAVASVTENSEVAVAAWYPSRFNTSDALRISVPMFVGALPRTLLAEFKKGK